MRVDYYLHLTGERKSWLKKLAKHGGYEARCKRGSASEVVYFATTLYQWFKRKLCSRPMYSKHSNLTSVSLRLTALLLSRDFACIIIIIDADRNKESKEVKLRL